MTDRELLERAAKATGINIKMDRIDADDKFIGFIVGARNTSQKSAWNPLADDGDALRLAVKLGFGISIPLANKRTDVVCFSDSRVSAIEEYGDQYAATRRAIVRAAAAIGASQMTSPLYNTCTRCGRKGHCAASCKEPAR